jgi:Kef-type K+ transport system membrane component KefB
MSNFEIGIHLFLQLAVIIAICRFVGWLGRRFLGQTQVFMEMVAGVLLGPSVFGLIAPEAQAWLFPKQLLVNTAGVAISIAHPNMTILYALAQIGLVLYMFVIGLEFDLGLLRGRARSASLVSGTGILVPFAAAGVLLPYLIARDDLLTEGISPGVAWLFIGASISITAFPMLARILFERGIASTRLGTLALAAGSIDDAIAWCLLALVLALFQHNPAGVVMTAGGGIVYGVVMLTLGRKLLRRFTRTWVGTTELTTGAFSTTVILLMICAWITDGIGIYAVFGAFICGAAMPKGALGDALTQRIEQLTTSLFLPMFFVYSGLNTKIGLLNTSSLWLVTAVVIAVSILGKGVACMAAARISGETWRHSAVIGTLMNARGLMELILLNIVLERGLITPTLFTIMVIMAMVTTGLTSPIYYLLSRGLVLDGARAPGTRIAHSSISKPTQHLPQPSRSNP